ncbi:SDR family NAD(P)-dependent oxidoreductase [Chloroflexi bacterium TSY]|nr:SDR family NAD(P)-dependent oxidoreductase [Chloroflexi bacterium TSY]
MTHPVLTADRVAVVTGSASGIGLAAAKRFAALRMKVCMADIDGEELNQVVDEVREISPGTAEDVLPVAMDVGKLEDVEALKETVYNTFGEVGLLMNNAGVRAGGGPWENYEGWQEVFHTNLWGVINGVQTFIPAMFEQGTPCMVVNTGSKQGITTPPGNTAYNVTKAGVKALTEGLQHQLRNTEGCQITAHLLVPGWTTTGKREHKPGAWLPDQTVGVMMEALEQGDFYIICPDDEVTPQMDKERILWAAGDLVYNRPPLSRWHPDYAEEFKQFSIA